MFNVEYLGEIAYQCLNFRQTLECSFLFPVYAKLAKIEEHCSTFTFFSTLYLNIYFG